jgi:hypothetical protein
VVAQVRGRLPVNKQGKEKYGIDILKLNNSMRLNSEC